MIIHDYLLWVSDHELDSKIKNYFAGFNISIRHQNNLLPLNITPHCAGLIISWDLIKNQIPVITQLYHNYLDPIIIFHEKYDEKICIQVLEAGADDFIVLPLMPRELHARLSAMQRRVFKPQAHQSNNKEVIIFGNWRLYPGSRQLFDNAKKEISLSTGEYDLLLNFVQNPQKILDREHLLQLNKDDELSPFDRRIDVQISRLRQKIEVDNKKPKLIKTIRNGGYLFTARVVHLHEDELE